MRKALVVSLAAAVAATGAALAAAPAQAACTVTSPATSCTQATTAQLVVAAGGLSLDVSTAGTTVTLAPAQGVTAILPSAAVTGSLGTTAVSDSRGSSTGWTVTVAATDFVSGQNTIPISNATLAPGTVGSLPLPTVCGLAGVVTLPTSVALATTAKQLGKCANVVPTVVVGANSAQWSNTMSLTVPADAVAGTYTSTVTQSVQ